MQGLTHFSTLLTTVHINTVIPDYLLELCSNRAALYCVGLLQGTQTSEIAHDLKPTRMEQTTRIKLAFSDWKSDVLTIELCLHGKPNARRYARPSQSKTNMPMVGEVGIEPTMFLM